MSDQTNSQNQGSQQGDQSQSNNQNQDLENKIKAMLDAENAKKEDLLKAQANEEQSVQNQDQPPAQGMQDPKDELIAKLQKELEEMKSIAIRATADYQNLKKRTDDEKMEYVKYANAKLLLEILPFIDNMKRAVSHLPENLQSNEWAQGVIHIGNQMLDTLMKLGLEKIKTIGQKFDANLHEALMQMPGEKDFILQEVEEGYSLNGRVIRYAKVVVGNGESVNNNKEPTDVK
ncbi:MAG: molecular chaperone GrpE [Candidatus Peregrinibacteria bacterium GW2011_GWF2_33_10]|nr:MAG: molecular chaperone GrpE [Candidatus Peregrinibacteria bacterium GW2011_GWF2_33_10]OGJ44349.1 MAG: nucleotide exchange factor GrpE [Candidatus Peregrinibacteria bacterium RIFOXYA12_FULL_33_12]OGJ44477.1 MAG: nucleotide exchange factor GrpE [Candidatus Peregrinibacteria bacterium RIFOXYA2_FULL_33_21]OGJ50227.1 MAG: nucleotide exchange factor GrpE [Candidatus Peregrinibacteria bacterium RIFOXYB2_FULL_33_20]